MKDSTTPTALTLDEVKEQLRNLTKMLEDDESIDILEYLDLTTAAYSFDETELQRNLDKLKNAESPALREIAVEMQAKWKPQSSLDSSIDDPQAFPEFDQLIIDINNLAADPGYDILDQLDQLDEAIATPAPAIKAVSAPAKKVLNTGKVVIGNMLDKTQNAILVDAANEKTMNGDGGISGAIKKFYQAKGTLKNYVADLLKFPVVGGKRCPNGEVKLTRTDGVDVIHTSAPDLRQKSNRVKGSKEPTDDAKKKLFEAYYNTFRMAYVLNYGEDKQQRSLSCPILGSGIYQWPPEMSAQIAGKALIAFRRKYGNDVKVDFYMHPSDLKNGLTETKIQSAIEKGFKSVAFAPVVDTSPKAPTVKDKTVGLQTPDKPLPIPPTATTTQPVAAPAPAVDPHKNAILNFLDKVTTHLKSPYANKEAKQNMVNDANIYRAHADPEISGKAEAIWPQIVGLAQGLVLPQKPKVSASEFVNVNVSELYEKQRSVSGADSLRSLARNAVKKVAYPNDPEREKQIASIQTLVDNVNKATTVAQRKQCSKELYVALEGIKTHISENKKAVSLSSALAKVCDKLIAKIPEQELKEFKASIQSDEKPSKNKHRRN
jgi:O-acetyl-ADP-ribose deacetylase (regulator of RNase III)